MTDQEFFSACLERCQERIEQIRRRINLADIANDLELVGYLKLSEASEQSWRAQIEEKLNQAALR